MTEEKEPVQLELSLQETVEIEEKPPQTDHLPQMVAPLLHWFEEHARILPWRNHPTAYRVWVSEIMLQQTRVEAVKPYFQRFITELPDIQSLAECPEEKLLKLWEGLGYYNRVRNMQEAAKTVKDEYNGRLPEDSSPYFLPSSWSAPHCGLYSRCFVQSSRDRTSPIVPLLPMYLS